MHVHWSPRVADLRELDEVDVGVLLAVLGVHGLAPEPKHTHARVKQSTDTHGLTLRTGHMRTGAELKG